MNLKQKFLKPKDAVPPQANSHTQQYASKQYSHKKLISPVSSEEIIRKEMKPSGSNVLKAPAKNQKNIFTVNFVKSDGNEKLITLSSNLDEKLIRRRKLLAFIAKVVLWSIIFYVLVLSSVPAIQMVVSRWHY